MRATVAALVAFGAFFLYRATLLPGFDLGDTASFQTMGGLSKITPRDAYPLYYAIARPVVPLFDNQAYAMNLLSAFQAALACGVIVLVGVELTGSLLAAIAAALLFAGSYTFWSQAVIAEVYGLHLLLVAVTLLLLLRWSRDPTYRRLCWFFAVYALAFGNHLSMILLLPAYATFLVTSAPDGWRSLLSRRIVLAAAAAAAAGALQYAWNFSSLWREVVPPASFGEALRTFWFDTTKTDWRETMVLEVPAVMAAERLNMYAFDLLQQFGWVPPSVAAVGLVHLAWHDLRRLALILLIFVVTLGFALGYNVGDAHVFLLPSHLAIALLSASGVVAAQRAIGPRRGRLIPIALIALAGWNVFANYPALDRSNDRRPTAVLSAMTDGISERSALLLTEMNWQLQNGLTYFGQYVRPEVLHAWLPEVMLYAPALIRDNRAIDRVIVATERAAGQIRAAYGPLYRIEIDRAVPTLESVIRTLPRGSRYVLCVLKPTREFSIDYGDLERATGQLTGGERVAFGRDDYTALAGRVGSTPAFFRGSSQPFRGRIDLDGLNVDVRMESWLAFDTIRRMGFGHVIANRHHSLIVERGISFVALDDDGRPLTTAYAAGIFAPHPRYLVLSSN
jgi:Protein of unknown function (DUF2723)